MPMIDTDLIKPASDAVQEAIGKMRDINADISLLEIARPAQPEKIRKLEESRGPARQVYELALIALSDKVAYVIKHASAAK